MGEEKYITKRRIYIGTLYAIGILMALSVMIIETCEAVKTDKEIKVLKSKPSKLQKDFIITSDSLKQKDTVIKNLNSKYIDSTEALLKELYDRYE